MLIMNGQMQPVRPARFFPMKHMDMLSRVKGIINRLTESMDMNRIARLLIGIFGLFLRL